MGIGIGSLQLSCLIFICIREAKSRVSKQRSSPLKHMDYGFPIDSVKTAQEALTSSTWKVLRTEEPYMLYTQVFTCT